MRIVVLSICFFMCLATKAGAQEVEYATEVQTYLKQNGTSGQYEYAYDGLLKMLQNQYPETEANQKGWTFLKENKNKSVNEILTLLTPVYQRHFNREEISEMTSFYESDAGRQLISDRSQMTPAQKEELNAYYNTTLGKKVISKQTELSQEISKVSEDWSRQLYEVAVGLLK